MVISGCLWLYFEYQKNIIKGEDIMKKNKDKYEEYYQKK